MSRGGSRPNAGRKPGSPNKATAERQAEIEASGITPLEYMLATLRDENKSTEERMEAAKSAAPYVHPKLAAVELSGDKDNPIVSINRIELVAADGNSSD